MKFKPVNVFGALLLIVVLLFSTIALAEEIQINLMADSRPEFARMMMLVPEFTAETGIAVNMFYLQETPLRARTALELSAPSTDFDVIMLDFLFLPHYADLGFLEPLDDYLAEIDTFQRDDFMGPFLGALEHDGNLYGLPLYQDCNILIYRADLFAEHEIDVPETFDDLMFAAVELTGIEPGFYGIGLRGQRGMGVNEWTWPSFLHGFGGRYYDDDMRPTLNSPEAIQALEYYVDLVTHAGPPGTATYSYIEVQGDLMEGNVAMIIDSATLGIRAEDPAQSQVAGKLGYAVVPGEVERQPGFYTWTLIVPANSHQKEAAAKFAAWLVSPEVAKVVGWSAPNQALEVVYDIPAFADYDQSEPLIDVMHKSLDLADPDYRPRIPEQSEVGTAISIAISEAIMGVKSPEEALNDAQAKVEEILTQAGYF